MFHLSSPRRLPKFTDIHHRVTMVRPLKERIRQSYEDPKGGNLPCCLPVRCRHLGLRPVEYLLELADTVPHTRVHVGLGALDVVVKVVSE